MIPEQFHGSASGTTPTPITSNSMDRVWILGFTEDISKAQSVLKGHRLEVVYTF